MFCLITFFQFVFSLPINLLISATINFWHLLVLFIFICYLSIQKHGWSFSQISLFWFSTTQKTNCLEKKKAPFFYFYLEKKFPTLKNAQTKKMDPNIDLSIHCPTYYNQETANYFIIETTIPKIRQNNHNQ